MSSMQSILSIAILLLIFSVVQGLRGISHYKTSGFRQSIMELMDQKGIVTMYKKEGCPYCKAAKELLEKTYELDIKYVDIESANREEILSQMRSFSGGRNTVPQIFFNAEHLGGNDDVQKLHSENKLKEKVEYVKNTPVTMMQDHWYHPWY